MPVYEYRCKECGYEFDKHQSFSEARLTDCPSCEAKGALRKVFGNVGVTFKGSGFYRTDSRSTDSSSLSSNGSKNGAKPSESKTESKSESKPAKTAAAKAA
ncbi:FmdB family zinc ribbon protein [Glycomyces terrestris]|uniref:Zinc ribbon domain-containing protein n=1 Tax=Glycomyces terrestris TaxID=2493553 RepID=A0A426UXJ4_9ACTN|nr:zinc ribbon domain-containing protein [Glycomyces terrestris]RRR99228.1 zinc ribbon domain-containing protein [Glycomyces terrestris]